METLFTKCLSLVLFSECHTRNIYFRSTFVGFPAPCRLVFLATSRSSKMDLFHSRLTKIQTNRSNGFTFIPSPIEDIRKNKFKTVKDQVEQLPQPSKNQFEENGDVSDISLLVEGRKLHVSKSVLMLHSPVFKTMFTADFKEKDLTEIPLEEKKYTVMVNLLDQIYPGEGTELIRDDTLEDLLHVADEYQVEQVFRNCKKYIEMQLDRKSIELATGKIVFYLGIVDQYEHHEQLHSLRKQLVELASCRRVSRLQSSKRFQSLAPATLKDVFLRRLQKMEDDRRIADRLKEIDLDQQ